MKQVDISDLAPTSRPAKRNQSGMSLLELIIVLLIGSVLTAMAIPQVKRSLYQYRLSSEVAMITWAIQSTRFQSLMEGYPYQVVFTQSSNSYQIQSEPTGSASFSNVGSSVPMSTAPITIDQNMTVQVKPNGSLSVTVGTTPLTVTYQGGITQITVTSYGNVLVSIVHH